MAHDQFMCKVGYQTLYRSYRMMVSHWPLLWLPVLPWRNKLCCQFLTACHTVWKDATPNTADIPHLIWILDGWRQTDCLLALSGCWPWLFSSVCVICEGDMIYVKNNRSLNFSTKTSSEMIFHRWGRKDRTRGEWVSNTVKKLYYKQIRKLISHSQFICTSPLKLSKEGGACRHYMNDVINPVHLIHHRSCNTRIDIWFN